MARLMVANLAVDVNWWSVFEVVSRAASRGSLFGSLGPQVATDCHLEDGRPPAERLVRQSRFVRVARCVFATAATTQLIEFDNPAGPGTERDAARDAPYRAPGTCGGGEVARGVW